MKYETFLNLEGETYEKLPIYKENPTLIDQFTIIGYEKELILNDFQLNELQENFSSGLSIIEKIKSDPNKILLDDQDLISLSFANSSISWIKSDNEPESYFHVFYSFSYYGYCYVFYETYSHYLLSLNNKNNKCSILNDVWIPKVFVILSLYPCFSFYNQFLKDIRQFYYTEYIRTSDDNDVVRAKSFTQLNSKYTLESTNNKNSNKNLQFNNNNNNDNENEFIERIKSNIKGLCLVDIKRFKKDISFVELDIYNIVTLIPPPFLHDIEFHFSTKFKYNLYKFGLFPYIDYNIGLILSQLSPKQLIKVFIYALLEFDLFIFSDNIHFGSLFSISIQNLLFPLFENPQFERIFSANKKIFEIEEDQVFTKFIENPHSVVINLNGYYDESIISNINETRQNRDGLIVDLNNKNLIEVHDKKDPSSMALHKLIQNLIDSLSIISRSNSNECSNANNLNGFIENLYKKLNKIYNLIKQTIQIDKSSFSAQESNEFKNIKRGTTIHKSSKDSQIHKYSNSNLSYIHYSNDQLSSFESFIYNQKPKSNIIFLIQDAFYDFILNVMSIIYENYFIIQEYEEISLDKHNSKSKRKKKVIPDHENVSSKLGVGRQIENNISNYIGNESVFWNQIDKQNFKIQNFFTEFLIGGRRAFLNQKYILPYIFTEEFLSLKLSERKNNILYNIPYSLIAESFYDNDLNSERSFKIIDLYSISEQKLEFLFERMYSDVYQNNKLGYNSSIHNNIKFKNSKINENSIDNSFGSTINIRRCSTNVSFQISVFNYILADYEYYIAEFDKIILIEYQSYLMNNSEYNSTSFFIKKEFLPSCKMSSKKIRVEEIVDFIESFFLSNCKINKNYLTYINYFISFILTRNFKDIVTEASELSLFLTTIEPKISLPLMRKYINLLMSNYNYSYISESSRQLIKKEEASLKNIFLMIIINFLRKEDVTPNSVMKNILLNISAYEEYNNEELNKIIIEVDEKIRKKNVNVILLGNICKCSGVKKFDDLNIDKNILLIGNVLVCDCTPGKYVTLISKYQKVELKVDMCYPYELFTMGNFLIFKLFNNLKKIKENFEFCKNEDYLIRFTGFNYEECVLMKHFLINLHVYINGLDLKIDCSYISKYIVKIDLLIKNYENLMMKKDEKV